MEMNAQNNLQVRYRIKLLRISLGIVYLWFGLLKFFPNSSPAEVLAKNTVHALSYGLIPYDFAYIALAILESLIGLLLISRFFQEKVIWLAIGHILMTFSPMFLFPSEIFTGLMTPTLLGQYLIKNLVLISALYAIDVRICDENKKTYLCY